MAIEVHEITPEQSERILSLEEGHFGDLKSIDVAPAKLTRTIAALANADGGDLFIGIDERRAEGKRIREWRGFSNQEVANGHIQIFEQLFPLGQDFAYSFLKTDDATGLVLHIVIDKTREVMKASDQIVYLRRGAQNLPVVSEEGLKRLKLDKGVTSFETETLDIDLSTVTNSETIIKFMLGVVPTAEPEAWLRKQMLIRGDRPTVACILLFADTPQAILPKRCAIKIYRYTTKADGTRDTLAFDPITVEGCAYDQIKDAVSRTVQVVEEIKKLGPNGLEKIEYPVETLHEIVTNAVLHRDYSIPSDVHIRIYDNRVEVESPGRLPGHVTVDNILTEQFARNGGIVRLINKFPDPPNKDVGEGLNTAFDAMHRLRLKPPVITETQHSVVVKIRHESLASPEEAVMDYLDSHEAIKNSIARDITGIRSENSMKEVFYKLRDRGLIERVPGLEGAAAAWRKRTVENCNDSENDPKNDDDSALFS